MGDLRYRIEKGFSRFTHRIYRNRIKTIIIMLLFTAAIISQIPKITVDTSMEGFLHEDDPAMLAYNAFRDQFGRDEVVIVALKPTNVFNLQFLKTLAALHDELEEKVPYIDDITSMINARNTRGEQDELIVEDLLAEWPANDKEMVELKKRVLSNPVYRNTMISEDGLFTTIIIRTNSHSSIDQDSDLLEGFDETDQNSAPDPNEKPGPAIYLTDSENSEVVFAIQSVVEKYRKDDLPIWVAGSPVVTHFLKQSMMRDIRKFLLLATLTVGIVLYLMFRRA